MKTNNNTQMTVEDEKAIAKINVAFNFRQNMNKIRSHYGF